MAFVYILRCADHTLYIGHTDNLPARKQEHNDGTAARYTARRRPVIVVYAEEHASTARAIARERQLKRWTANKKEALIAGDLKTLKTLSKRRR
jgi:putative endonuclease